MERLIIAFAIAILIPVAVVIILIFSYSKNKKNKLESLLEVKDEGEFIRRIIEYMFDPLKGPYDLPPYALQTRQSVYDYFKYNFLSHFRQETKQQRMTFLLMSVFMVSFEVILMGATGLGWTTSTLVTLISIVAWVMLYKSQSRKIQKEETDMSKLEQKFNHIMEVPH